MNIITAIHRQVSLTKHGKKETLQCLKEYYEIVGESRPLSAFFPKHTDFLTKQSSKFQSDPSPA